VIKYNFSSLAVCLYWGVPILCAWIEIVPVAVAAQNDACRSWASRTLGPRIWTPIGSWMDVRDFLCCAVPCSHKSWDRLIPVLESYRMSKSGVKLSTLFDDVCGPTQSSNYTRCAAPNFPNLLLYNTDMNIKIKAMELLTMILRSGITLPDIIWRRCRTSALRVIICNELQR
jgi:hypothetical protein